MAKRRLIERYILRTIFPYGVAALLLLTAILFVQQTGRYFETIFHGVMPAEFVYGLALALLPTVLVFTIPMAVLCGTIIGLGRMSSDSELVAMRAAGVTSATADPEGGRILRDASGNATGVFIDGAQSLIREQVEMGVAVRMACLEILAADFGNNPPIQ